MPKNIELAYVAVEASDPDLLERYLENTAGAMRGLPTVAGEYTLRLDQKVQRLIIENGPKNDCVAVGFEATDQQAFDNTYASLARHGATWEEGAAVDCENRRVKRLVRTSAPWGIDVELVIGLADATAPFKSANNPSGFVTASRGFGHAVFRVNDDSLYRASCEFAKALGLRLTDWLEMDLPQGKMRVSFMHCNERHHSIALACMPQSVQIPRVLHHVSFEVPEVGQVGEAFDRALKGGTPIANLIGQHDNDEMISFYGQTPSGWLLEIGAEGRVVTEDWTDVRAYNRISRWGHQTPSKLMELLL